MTTLPVFRMSITSAEPAAPATQADLSQVLDFGFGNGTDSWPARGSFQYDREYGGYNLSWESIAEFDTWRQDQKRADTIDLCLAHTERGTHHFSWKRIYHCSRQGSGGTKPYEKKHPDRIRKFGPKWIGCSCKVDLKAYPGTNVLLGRYLSTHDHPIGMKNIIYTRVSKETKGKVRGFLEQSVERSAIVCNRRAIDFFG
jgi:hypothetical protein